MSRRRELRRVLRVLAAGSVLSLGVAILGSMGRESIAWILTLKPEVAAAIIGGGTALVGGAGYFLHGHFAQEQADVHKDTLERMAPLYEELISQVADTLRAGKPQDAIGILDRFAPRLLLYASDYSVGALVELREALSKTPEAPQALMLWGRFVLTARHDLGRLNKDLVPRDVATLQRLSWPSGSPPSGSANPGSVDPPPAA